MSNLLTKEHINMFADLSLLYATDYFVADQIYRYLYRSNDRTDRFFKMREIIDADEVGYHHLTQYLQLKTTMNPLLGLMYDPNIDDANAFYDSILYDNSYSMEFIATMLKKTSIGESLTVLLKDDNLEKFYIYMDVISEPICKYIFSTVVEPDKIHFVSGNKVSFLEKNPCNDFFLKHVDEISIIADLPKMNTPRTIYLPEYSYNMKEDKIFVNSPIPVDELEEKYNILINTIKLPLF